MAFDDPGGRALALLSRLAGVTEPPSTDRSAIPTQQPTLIAQLEEPVMTTATDLRLPVIHRVAAAASALVCSALLLQQVIALGAPQRSAAIAAVQLQRAPGAAVAMAAQQPLALLADARGSSQP